MGFLENQLRCQPLEMLVVSGFRLKEATDRAKPV